MKFYRVNWREDEPTARTTEWAKSKAKANALARESGDPDASITEVHITPTWTGLLEFLNREIWCDASRVIAQVQRDLE